MKTLGTETPDRRTPWLLVGQPTGHKPFSPERKNLEQQCASLFSLMETASRVLKRVSSLLLLTITGFQGREKS